MPFYKGGALWAINPQRQILIYRNGYIPVSYTHLDVYKRQIDDSGEDYLYSPTEPGPVCDPNIRGKFEIVEDDEQGTLKKAING